MFLGILFALGALTSIILHTLGLHLLHKYRNRYQDKMQLILLINLSIIEILLPILIGIINIFLKGTEFRRYVHIFCVVCGTLLLPAILIYLTIHRFLQVYLNIRYGVFWNQRKTYILLAATWVFSILFGTIVVIFHKINTDLDFDVLWLHGATS